MQTGHRGLPGSGKVSQANVQPLCASVSPSVQKEGRYSCLAGVLGRLVKCGPTRLWGLFAVSKGLCRLKWGLGPAASPQPDSGFPFILTKCHRNWAA